MWVWRCNGMPDIIACLQSTRETHSPSKKRRKALEHLLELRLVICGFMGGLLSHDNKPNTCEIFSTLTKTVITVGFLPAGHARSARPASPKITLRFPHLYIYIYVCASALITCAIITSRTLLPCDLTLVDFSNLDGCFA